MREEEEETNSTQSRFHSALISIFPLRNPSLPLKLHLTNDANKMMKIFLVIILIAFLLLESPLVSARATGLDDSAWFNSLQNEHSNHQLIKRKGQAGRIDWWNPSRCLRSLRLGWGKRAYMPLTEDDERAYLLHAAALRSWWDEKWTWSLFPVHLEINNTEKTKGEEENKIKDKFIYLTRRRRRRRRKQRVCYCAACWFILIVLDPRRVRRRRRRSTI